MNTTQLDIHSVYTLMLFIWMAVVKVCAYFLEPSEERHAEHILCRPLNVYIMLDCQLMQRTTAKNNQRLLHYP